MFSKRKKYCTNNYLKNSDTPHNSARRDMAIVHALNINRTVSTTLRARRPGICAEPKTHVEMLFYLRREAVQI